MMDFSLSWHSNEQHVMYMSARLTFSAFETWGSRRFPGVQWISWCCSVGDEGV